MSIESNNGWPDKIKIIDPIARVKKIAAFLIDRHHSDAPDYMSNHYRGGAAMLDREMYEQPTLFDIAESDGN